MPENNTFFPPTYYIISGGFDPLHEGHIALINEAVKNSDGVIILLNSDDWLTRKKGSPFMTFTTRQAVCQSLKGIIEVIAFDDSDNSASDGIRLARTRYPDIRLVFANGGDRHADNIPETETCRRYNVELAFGIGGENKANSSSWILNRWEQKRKNNDQ